MSDKNGGWTISQFHDDQYQLIHPHYKSITHIPSFDVADEMRREMASGGFVRFVRRYEEFMTELRKRIISK